MRYNLKLYKYTIRYCKNVVVLKGTTTFFISTEILNKSEYLLYSNSIFIHLKLFYSQLFARPLPQTLLYITTLIRPPPTLLSFRISAKEKGEELLCITQKRFITYQEKKPREKNFQRNFSNGPTYGLFGLYTLYKPVKWEVVI